MDFAKKQLEKYGWSEGKGLGKNEDGVSDALKPKLKFDKTGIGHKSEYTDEWWDKLFNKAASSLEVSNGKVAKVPKEISDNQQYRTKSEYAGFVCSEGLPDRTVPGLTEEPELLINKPLTDDELLSACGGRTAHKGARHGLTQRGKLSRIDKQEKMLLKKLQRVSISDDPDTSSAVTKKIKKLRQHKTPADSAAAADGTAPLKKKKKKRKSVTFNEETEVKYYSQEEAETSFESTLSNQSTKDENSNEPAEASPSPQTTGSDEGIEQDIDLDNRPSTSSSSVPGGTDDHRSFEEAQHSPSNGGGNISDLSNAEKRKRKMMKRKREDEPEFSAAGEPLIYFEGEPFVLPPYAKKFVCAKVQKCRDCEGYILVEDLEELKRREREKEKEKEKEREKERLRVKREKRRRKKERKRERGMISAIADAFGTVCKISEPE